MHPAGVDARGRIQNEGVSGPILVPHRAGHQAVVVDAVQVARCDVRIIDLSGLGLFQDETVIVKDAVPEVSDDHTADVHTPREYAIRCIEGKLEVVRATRTARETPIDGPLCPYAASPHVTREPFPCLARWPT